VAEQTRFWLCVAAFSIFISVNVYSSPGSFYAEFRVSSGSVPLLRDDQDFPPEQLVQAIWFHQRLLRDQLATLDGQRVRVLHPGFLNLEGGPDFRDACIQLGDDVPKSGDVEVDLRSGGWRAHQHDRNPAFANVVMHVVWESEKPAGHEIPTLPLKGFLDAPLGDLGLWLGGEVAKEIPEEFRGKCCAPLKKLEHGQVLELLRQAAEVRLQSKASEFRARARQAGWDQALWEKMFRGLGYKHNTWPMQCLGELKPRWHTSESQPGLVHARLLGISGLLPADLPHTTPGTDHYVRSVWDSWWRERDTYADCILPSRLWRFHGIRPANHPQRRLALAAHWVTRPELPRLLQNWCATEVPRSQWGRTLFELLNVKEDEFWSWHWTFKSARFKAPQPLLGSTRLTDLAINIVLPWLWARALTGDEQIAARVKQRYLEWQPAEDNSVLRHARQRLLGTSSPALFTTASSQQGLIQIVRDFCDHSNSLCDRCKLPELVNEFGTVSMGQGECFQ
jgi:hypothetical protein